MTFCVYELESRDHHTSWITLKLQSKFKYQRNSDGYFVGVRYIEFRPKRSWDGYMFCVKCHLHPFDDSLNAEFAIWYAGHPALGLQATETHHWLPIPANQVRMSLDDNTNGQWWLINEMIHYKIKVQKKIIASKGNHDEVSELIFNNQQLPSFPLQIVDSLADFSTDYFADISVVDYL